MEELAHLNVRTVVFPTRSAACEAVAREIADLVREHTSAGRDTVLGLASGGSPIGVYEWLVREARAGRLDFSRVTTFNLDEYEGVAPEDPASFHHFMREQLFGKLGLDAARTHLPSGTVPAAEAAEHCARYESLIGKAGGIDLQLLGIGRNGHIGFNEPGSPGDSRTRRVQLGDTTRSDYARHFGEESAPTHALTMGVGTILEARRIRLLAFGEAKADIVRSALEGPIGPDVPASFLRGHDDVEFVLDEAAAARLR